MNETVERVTARIRERSRGLRAAYLARVAALRERPHDAAHVGCANLAHATAGAPADDKLRIVQARTPNLAIVSAYNDMLSAHQPYEGYPQHLRETARRLGATAQVAGGVPAMCDGVTQGRPGMELSLFSRDTIAMGTAVALSHDVFDGALLLGICDKIVPGLLIGALNFGHLPCVFVPSGPMPSGISNSAKTKTREDYATGKVGLDALLASEQASYHAPGTCTFYGTANSNQMLLEAMGLHVPGAAFAPPGSGLRTALTDEAVRLLLANIDRWRPIGHVVDERAIVDAMVALLATGGSTNHLIHWVAVARAAGILIDWTDFDELSKATPLVARVYPNGSADVNAFEAAGGPPFVLRELLAAGLLHADALAMAGETIAAQAMRPSLDAAGALRFAPPPAASGDDTVLRPRDAPFMAEGGLRLLDGNLGRAVIKVSSVPVERHVVEAPARVFDSQEAMLAAFAAHELERDVVVVVRFQGPAANGMPELHKLTPPLGVLQKQGFRVALVTDGRMSGASGQVPAAIHVCPEVERGGPLGRVRDGDRIRLDAVAGTLDALVDAAEWQAREPAVLSDAARETNAHGLGRDLFAGLRRHARTAEEGACTWL